MLLRLFVYGDSVPICICTNKTAISGKRFFDKTSGLEISSYDVSSSYSVVLRVLFAHVSLTHKVLTPDSCRHGWVSS